MFRTSVRVGLLATSLIVATSAAEAQDRSGNTQVPEQIRSVHADLLPLQAVAYVEVPHVDLEAVLKEDASRELEGLPPRFAIPNEVVITPDTHGTWEDLDPEHLIWRLRVQGFGARNLNLGFERYHMPPGGEMWIYSSDLEYVVRKFTAEDNEEHGELWTPIVPTDEMVIEVVVPKRVVEQLKLKLTRIGYGYRGFKTPTDPDSPASGSCNYDVVCPEGDGWRLDIPSVGVISTGGSTFCTGYMVNNARSDLAPYFMTAYHCGIRSTNAASLVVYWNYENSTCRPAGSSASGGPGDGTLNQFNTGSFFRAEYSPSDFTLVLLDDTPDPAFQLSYAGWDNSGTDASMAVGIHHPNTDEKRISFEFQPTTTTSYLGTPVPGDGTHVRITDWDLGTTEPGSSGSPLFNQDHHVIGQLHGGFASCTSQTSDWYGKFSVSWTGGGTNGTRLSNWLDPDSTGVLVVDTVSLDTLCSDAGEITLDRGSYGCEDTVSIRVVDCGLNLSPMVVDTVMITVDSSSETAGETLTLTETSAGSSRFEGTLPVSATDAPGTLLVGEGDAITANYIDADDGMGGTNLSVTASATVDCSPPVILTAAIINVGATSAELRITADEPVTAMADWGAACGAYTDGAVGTGLGSPAVVEISGLTPNTTYFVRAGAVDEAANVATDTNGGNCYSFTTDDVPNYNTEEFLGDGDLNNIALVLLPINGDSEYSLCNRGSIGALPTDPTGGTTLPLTDDDSDLVVLGGGKTVELYGVSYDRFYVGSNGYITFVGPDTDYTESLADHFAVPRVSAHFDDFNPAAGGTVSWKQLPDRVTVTWQNIPEYNTSNSNTFQVDLFFGGRIRLSYLSVASLDGIVGISAGGGLDPLFVEIDLSAASACVPSGPFVRQAAHPSDSATIQR